MCAAHAVRQVHALQEGAAEPLALLGLIRLVHYLCSNGKLPSNHPCSIIIIDSGQAPQLRVRMLASACACCP